jgi:hypothetical protein
MSTGVQTLTARLPAAVFSRDSAALLTTSEISGLTKTEAEELLDWLESNGNSGWELGAVNGSGFVIRRK